MRNAGLGLALAACAQLTLLSSPAFAQDSSSSAAASVSASTSSSSASSESSSAAPAGNPNKEKTGWIILGVGGAVAVGGIVLDIVGTQVGSNVPGQAGTTTTNDRTNFYWGGTTMIVAGLLAGIYGGSMILDARKQNVQPSQVPLDHSQDASVTKAMQTALSSAPVVQLPIVSAKF